MTLPDAGMIFAHWRRQPPLRTLVTMIAVALGVPVENFRRDAETPVDQSKKYTTEEEFRRLMEITGGKIEGIAQWG